METRPMFGGVFILGCHRSGTSCLAGMLQEAGLRLGQVSHRNRFNEKGNQESLAVVRLNKALLAANGGSWLEPRMIQTISFTKWLRIHIHAARMRVGPGPWGIKDPRMVFCLPAWRRYCSRLVGTFRNPDSVYRSLEQRARTKARGSTSQRNWYDLWCDYNQALVEEYEKDPFPMMNFDWEPHRYCRNIDLLARHLNLPGEPTSFYDEQLRRSDPPESSQTELPGRCRDLYLRLQKIAEHEEENLQRLAVPRTDQPSYGHPSSH